MFVIENIKGNRFIVDLDNEEAARNHYYTSIDSRDIDRIARVGEFYSTEEEHITFDYSVISLLETAVNNGFNVVFDSAAQKIFASRAVVDPIAPGVEAANFPMSESGVRQLYNWMWQIIYGED